MNERHAAPTDDPSDAALADLVRAAAGAAVPDAVLAAVARADTPEAGPQVGDLWRARRPDGGPVTMVWIRALTATGAVAVPASFDVELADEASLVVPAEASPLGLPLALHLGIEAAVERAALVDRLGTIDAAAAHEAGAPGASSPLDERIEHGHALADAVAGLAPEGDDAGRDEAGGWWPTGLDSDAAPLLMALHASLGATHPGARIAPRPAGAAGAEHVRAVAQVAELDAFVLVAFVDDGLEGSSLLEAARQVLHADQLLNAVCLVEPTAPFPAVVVDRRDVVAAIETPSGELRPPRQARPPTTIGNALTKFLDTAITPFGRLAGTVVDARAVDARGLAVDVSAEAVRSVEASARGYKVEGKRSGYERVTRHKPSIIRLVEEALHNPDVDVASILEQPEDER